MKKHLFLDDERNPSDVFWISIEKGDWQIVRSFQEAKDWVLKNGFPDVISFDHDLGTELSGYDFAKWLVEYDLDTGSMPEEFNYTVHSKNTVGQKNIEGLLNCYLQTKNIRIQQ